MENTYHYLCDKYEDFMDWLLAVDVEDYFPDDDNNID